MGQDEVSLTHLTDSIGRQQETTIINESGLYSVILRSDKPQAKPFRARGAPERWRFPKLFRFNGKRFQATGGENPNANRKIQISKKINLKGISPSNRKLLFSLFIEKRAM